MIVVTEAADSPDLVTLSAVKRDLGITGTDQEAALKSRITSASQFVASYLNRRLIAETVTETFLQPYCGNALVLSRYPVIALTSVAQDTLTIAAGGYYLDSEQGIITRAIFGWRSEWWGPVTVTYRGGYEPDEVPEDLQRAVIAMVQRVGSASDRDPFLRSRSLGPLSESYFENPELVPPDLANLARYRRSSVV